MITHAWFKVIVSPCSSSNLEMQIFFPCLVFVLALPGWITWLGIAGEALRVQMDLIFVPSTSEGHVSLWGGTKYEVFFRASRNVIFRVFARPVNKLSLKNYQIALKMGPRCPKSLQMLSFFTKNLYIYKGAKKAPPGPRHCVCTPQHFFFFIGNLVVMLLGVKIPCYLLKFQ